MDHPTCPAKIHNTLWAYRKHRCRCPAARAAKAAEHQRRRHRTAPPPRTTPTVDPVAVARACLGDRTIRLIPAEREQAIQALTAKGRSARWIAVQLGCATRTVVRHRTAHRNTSTNIDSTAA